MEKFDNTDAYTLSACRFEDAHGCAFGGQEQLFVEGYAQVPKVLASGLDVQLNTRYDNDTMMGGGVFVYGGVRIYGVCIYDVCIYGVRIYGVRMYGVRMYGVRIYGVRIYGVLLRT